MSFFRTLFKSKFEIAFFVLMLLSGIHWVVFPDNLLSGLILIAGVICTLIAVLGERIIKKQAREAEERLKQNVAQWARDVGPAFDSDPAFIAELEPIFMRLAKGEATQDECMVEIEALSARFIEQKISKEPKEHVDSGAITTPKWLS